MHKRKSEMVNNPLGFLKERRGLMSLLAIVLEIWDNLGSKDLNILKVTFSPESDDEVVCSSFDKTL